MAADSEGLSLVVTVAGHAPYASSLGSWRGALQKLGVAHEIYIISSGIDTEIVRSWLSKIPEAHWQHLEPATGIGGCLRAALTQVRYPFLLHLTLDYPYDARDLQLMWQRIHQRDAFMLRPPDLVNGCRNGRRTPWPWRVVGWSWQLFCRVGFGLPFHPAPPWHGGQALLRRWLCRWVYGVPLADPFSGCKLYRTDFLRRFPIQSDGPFVHVEIAAKATFLTSIIDEIYLSPQTADISVPPSTTLRADCWRCFRHPKFVIAVPKPAESPASASIPA
jgi:hypothetical protein